METSVKGQRQSGHPGILLPFKRPSKGACDYMITRENYIPWANLGAIEKFKFLIYPRRSKSLEDCRSHRSARSTNSHGKAAASGSRPGPSHPRTWARFSVQY